MRLNTKCSIALHCLIFMAEYKDRVRVTSGLLAKSTGCNPVIIRNIMAALQKEKVITVARGVGGARLAAAPEELMDEDMDEDDRESVRRAWRCPSAQ